MNADFSSRYVDIRQALLDRKTIKCRYKGLLRFCCPHTIGTRDGSPRVLMFQFAGDSENGLPPGGEYRCMAINDMTNIETLDGPWHTGDRHSKCQTCITAVDVEV